jgi:cytochrome c peroxidase
MKLVLTTILLSLFCVISSCKKAKDDGVVPKKDSDLVNLDYPSYLPEPTYDFKANPLSKRKIELGRMLFYDPILSRDSTISCASCHQPFAAFSHLAHSTSHGIDRQLGNRNAPGLYNLAWASGFMWDGAVPNIEVQPVAPITNHVEMDETILNVLRKLNRHPVYRSKFKLAFEEEKIESAQMLKSLAQFMLTIVSFNTKYDAYKAGKATLEPNELEGLVLVQQKCAACHAGELFTDFSFRNIGLDSTSGDPDDIGRQAFTGLPSDRRKFRVPSLRNFTNTYPYFHNGISNSLESVLKRHGIQDNTNLDPLLKGNAGFGLTPLEVNKIYDFISTLTDNTILQNPAFLTPFENYVIVH